MILMTALTLKSQTQKYKPRVLYLLMKNVEAVGEKKQGLEERYIFQDGIYIHRYIVSVLFLNTVYLV